MCAAHIMLEIFFQELDTLGAQGEEGRESKKKNTAFQNHIHFYLPIPLIMKYLDYSHIILLK